MYWAIFVIVISIIYVIIVIIQIVKNETSERKLQKQLDEKLWKHSQGL